MMNYVWIEESSEFTKEEYDKLSQRLYENTFNYALQQFHIAWANFIKEVLKEAKKIVGKDK